MEIRGKYMDGSEWVVPIQKGELTLVERVGKTSIYYLDREDGITLCLEVTHVEGRNFIHVSGSKGALWTDQSLKDFLIYNYHTHAIWND